MEKHFLTDIIGEDYKNWVKGDIALLSTPTGSGKTTFALGVYAVYAVQQGKRVLVLEPRTILVEQISHILKRIFAENMVNENVVYETLVKGIEVWGYQKLEEKLKNGNSIPNFDVVIADEAHYLLGDSTFNANTAMSYAYLLHQIIKRKAVVLLMSATIDKIREVFLRDTLSYIGVQSLGENGGKFVFPGKMAYDYALQPNYDYLDVKYLHSEDEMLEIASMHIGKILWFCSSKKRGEKLLAKLQERGVVAGMITADNKADDAASIVKSLTSQGKFSQKILLATSVLDVGVSIVDAEVRSVVLDAYDRETFLQMLGRIRMEDSGQRLNVYIFARKAENYRNLIEKQLVPQLNFMEKIAREKEEFKPAKIVEMMLNQPLSPSVYTQTTAILSNCLTNIRLNDLYLSYLDFEEGLQKDSGYAIKKQLSWLGLEDTFSEENYVDADVKTIKRDKIYQVIKEKGAGAMNGGLSKEKISQFLDEIKPEIRDLNPEYVRSNTPLSVLNFNKICKNEGLPFGIEQKEVERKQQYQLVCKNEDMAEIM